MRWLGSGERFSQCCPKPAARSPADVYRLITHGMIGPKHSVPPSYFVSPELESPPVPTAWPGLLGHTSVIFGVVAITWPGRSTLPRGFGTRHARTVRSGRLAFGPSLVKFTGTQSYLGSIYVLTGRMNSKSLSPREVSRGLPSCQTMDLTR